MESTLFAFLSTQDVAIVLILALIVFGPQKLPDIGRQIGSAMREFKGLSRDFQNSIDLDAVLNSPAIDKTRSDTAVAETAADPQADEAPDASEAPFIAPPGPRSIT